MKTCDECLKLTKSLVKRHKEKRYCRSCYQLYFRCSQCNHCRIIARLPTFEKKPICRTCEKAQPCIRCNRKGQPLGKLTKYGLVCKSCYHYFKASSQSVLPNSPINLGTCKRCHRHRKLEQSICHKCNNSPDIPCPICNKQMPAGRGNICWSCYWEDLFTKRVHFNATALEGSQIQSDWIEFCHWIQDRRGAPQGAILLSKYLPIFIEISSRWATIPEYHLLLIEFGTQKLRKYQNVILWLESIGKVSIDKQLKLDHSEYRRINAHLESLKGTPTHYFWIKSYHKHLMKKYQLHKIQLRSVRLALCPVSRFLRESNPRPTQTDLIKYLKNNKGQRCALSGFIAFANKHFQLNLNIPKKNSRKPNSRSRFLEKKLINTYQNKTISQSDEYDWIVYGLEYFHLLPKSLGLKVTKEQIIKNHDNSYTVLINEKHYWIPAIKSNHKSHI